MKKTSLLLILLLGTCSLNAFSATPTPEAKLMAEKLTYIVWASCQAQHLPTREAMMRCLDDGQKKAIQTLEEERQRVQIQGK